MGDESPKNKVKFLCSHAGKVLPRPSDGLLKYVGGETRVISVPRDITFSELMTKLKGMAGEGEMVLKYQLVPEDLDALVSVRNDEDLKHMIEEHDRHESGGTPLLRAFLFPTKPVMLENHQAAYWLEQRYIDAINGIIRTSPKAAATSSACSSPQSISPDGHTTCESPFHGVRHPNRMQKVRSSPSLTNLNSAATVEQQHAYPPSRPPQDPQLRLLAPGVGYYYTTSRHQQQHKGLGVGGAPYAYHQDDSAAYAYPIIERVHSVPRSPKRIIWD